ncbi:MAG: hypothetical protein LC627_05710, partial [Verrucomicrobiaceae bacterium]|nr:hypothetical protein [Verrucomicrobiaceae bacterium]
MNAEKGQLSAGRRAKIHAPPARPVLGIEVEFTLFVDDVKRRPERVFGTPQRLVRRKMLPRTGRSFQLPSGGAIYFDTGVIELATPIVELERGCCYRATRLLWEQIGYVRRELDAWGRRNRCAARLQGFSAHYNFSFPKMRQSSTRTARRLADLLAHILPMPVILLAANRKSSAVGVRPRGDRLEITADFTPDAALMLAVCGFIAGVVETVLHWHDYSLRQIDHHGLPRLGRYVLRRHSSRRGRRILAGSLAHNPFTADASAPIWRLRDRRLISLRQLASETLPPFRKQIARLSDRETLRHIEA